MRFSMAAVMWLFVTIAIGLTAYVRGRESGFDKGWDAHADVTGTLHPRLPKVIWVNQSQRWTWTYTGQMVFDPFNEQ